MQIQCSNCGARQRFKYSAANVNSLIALGWDSLGDALYCPKCVETWSERNGDRELYGKENTVQVIDRFAGRSNGI